MKCVLVLSIFVFQAQFLQILTEKHHHKVKNDSHGTEQASPVSVMKRMSTNPTSQFPPNDEIQIIEPGALYVHVTTTNRWKNIDKDNQVKRVKGMVNALGLGFYTYPASVIENADGKKLSELLQWVHFDKDDKEGMETELHETVRVVTVSPKYKVRAWMPDILPQKTEITAMETKLSDNKQLNFLAIIGSSYETAWLKAKVASHDVPEGMIFPTDTQVQEGIVLAEDGLPMDWLVTTNVRQLTEKEISLYIEHAWGK